MEVPDLDHHHVVVDLDTKTLQHLQQYQAHLQSIQNRPLPTGITPYKVTLQDAIIVLLDQGWRRYCERDSMLTRPTNKGGRDW